VEKDLIRSHYCGRIGEEDIDKSSTLMGWVHRTRDMGGIIFVDLRDRTGISQIVFDSNDIDEEDFRTIERIRSEYVIGVKGVIRERDEETYNPRIPTGTVELKAEEFEILSKSKPLPFEIEDSSNVREELRLKHRYLELRDPKLYNNLVLKHNTVKSIRKYLEDREFLDVETPILTKSTPEGARDYLVPSRIQTGSFYALPQSPQIFKQLLMASGIDRYYQIARCFRDEDLRSDRQPEFTQVDMELSFVSQEEVLGYLEEMFKNIFYQVLDIKIEEKFPRLTYKEAIDLYGTDKPDIRFEMPIVDLTDIAAKCNFKVFRNVVDNGGLVRALNIKGGNSFTRNEIDILTEDAISYGAEGMAWIGIGEDGELRSVLTKFFEKEEIDNILDRVKAEPGDLIIFCADSPDIVYRTLGNLRLDIGDKLGLRDKDEYKFLIVTDFPLLQWNSEEQRYVAMHHPFTMPALEDLDLLESEPEKVKAQAYDIVLNGVELGSGSIRIHKEDIQEKMFQVLGFSKEKIEERFGFILESFSYGTPPHGGFAFGLDRLIMMMAGSESIRDVIAFPKNRDAVCLLSQAPSTVASEQLETLKLEVAGNEKKRDKTTTTLKEASNLDIDRLGELSQLNIDKNEKEEYRKYLKDRIEFTSKIKELDMSEYKPTVNIHPVDNVVRSDKVNQKYTRDELLSNGSTVESGYILVPKLIEEN